MNHPKLLLSLFVTAVLTVNISFAQDTIKKKSTVPAVVHTERIPVYPNGTAAFNKYIMKNLEYPDVARIVGLTGNVVVSFVIDSDGSVRDVAPVQCLGAGCESEAARVIASMPKWKPGIQDGRPVRVQYSVPIGFYLNSDGAKITTRMRDLRNSDYGFFFYIKGKTYSLDEAQAILGKSFDASNVAAVENYDDPTYTVPDKKAVYLIVMKDS
jgi:protein TonB